MGSILSSYISRVDVYKSPNEQEQRVVFSTPDSRTCTLGAIVGVDSAIVSLRDYTFDRFVGTGVDISVRNNIGGTGYVIGATHAGNITRVPKEAGEFLFSYGDQRDRCGVLFFANSNPNILYVTHSYGTREQRFSFLVLAVWYDDGRGCFRCKITGPSWHSSTSEFEAASRAAVFSTTLEFNGQQQIKDQDHDCPYK